MRDTSIVILSGLLLGSIACSRPTEAQCDKAFDHYFNVKMKGVLMIQKVDAIKFEERRAKFLSQCVNNVQTTVIRCWLDSNTLERIESCQQSSMMRHQRDD